MRKGATTLAVVVVLAVIVALRNEKGSYNRYHRRNQTRSIVALRNEKGSYNPVIQVKGMIFIVALRNEKGSYN